MLDLDGINDNGSTTGLSVVHRVGAPPAVRMLDHLVPLDVLVLMKFSTKFRKTVTFNGRLPRITYRDGNPDNCAYTNLLFERLADDGRVADTAAIRHVLHQHWLLGLADEPCPGPWVAKMAGVV